MNRNFINSFRRVTFSGKISYLSEEKIELSVLDKKNISFPLKSTSIHFLNKEKDNAEICVDCFKISIGDFVQITVTYNLDYEMLIWEVEKLDIYVEK